MTGLSSRTSAEPPAPVTAIFGVGSLSRDGAPISESEAARLAAAQWGIEGTVRPLAAEVDQNFRIATPAGSYLLKVVPVDEDESLTGLVTAALLHLEEASDVEVPRVIRTHSGAAVARFLDADGAGRRARVTTFLEGRILRSMQLDEALRRRLGGTLARLAAALRGFDHGGADRELSWDLRHAGRMGAMLAELGPGERREAPAACLERFESETVPRLDALPRQIVHNDLSRDNAVLADDGSLGVIDFGDIVRTQRVNDLAIAMADQLDAAEDMLGPALDVAAGYVEVVPLDAAELAVLYELVRTRVATRIVGGEWRAHRFPANRRYLARNVERLREVFARLPDRLAAADAERIDSLPGGAAR